MAAIDIMGFDVTDLPNQSLTVNRFAIEFNLVDSQTQQAVLLDRKAGNRLVWPNGLSGLTVAERRRVIRAAIDEWLRIEIEKLG